MQLNPVVFDGYKNDPDLTKYSEHLSEVFRWRNTVVGLTSQGFLYVDDRVGKKGYYEYNPKLLTPADIVDVTISRRFSIKSLIYGLLALAIGTMVFVAGWTTIGPGVVTIPIIMWGAGVVLTLGMKRNQIRVTGRTVTYQWLSAPLAYQRTLSICTEAAAFCRKHRIQFKSHVE